MVGDENTLDAVYLVLSVQHNPPPKTITVNARLHLPIIANIYMVLKTIYNVYAKIYNFNMSTLFLHGFQRQKKMVVQYTAQNHTKR